jgi:hypothetical protein
MGLLRVMHPVASDGKPDPARPTIFTGEAQLMTNVGPLPISFDIPGTDAGGSHRQLRERREGRRRARDAGDRRDAAAAVVVARDSPGGCIAARWTLRRRKIQLP